MRNENKKDKKLFLLFSHKSTWEQLTDAGRSLGVESVVDMPEDLKKIWKQIPPDTQAINPLLEPVKNWLLKQSKCGDFALIQGDFGATWLMVNYTLKNGLVPVYSTTERRASETLHQDGTITTEHVFQHRRFRLYGN